ncbi:C2 family cysteine protease [Anabaena subtropica]|uniref:Calpain catalytic domain-containing protein n=1 Tax=Anabaena subtropica FACHB-260 TaxID=2692884 RepID=A0ABR8CUQ7_9NOST|nr:C2 family cysteine protease [Anabaena subtropica]MBD2346613.1 hypothetical protein [Anabaena subtropica FACHB-260]
MPVNFFNANFYRVANSDLAAAGLITDAQLQSHFQNHGLNEGRSFSPFVNLSLYRASNPDLAAAGLRTNQQLLNHLQNNGVADGRRFSEFVDIDFYLASNSDLNQAFRGNREQALNHLSSYGVEEGRRFSPFFDINRYASYNPDLPTAFAQAVGRRPFEVGTVPGFRLFLLYHLELAGVNEGRDYSNTFNVNYYRSVNSDLAAAGLNNQQLYNHFQLNGLREGRASSFSFNVRYYLNNNSDLRAVFGANYSQAYNHFITSGQREGRRGNEYGSFLTGAEVSTGAINLQTGSQTVSASLSTSDRPNPTRLGSYSDDYRLFGIAAGQQIQLNLNAGFDAYLQLVNATTGRVIAEDDDSGFGLNSQLTFTVQSGVEYIVRTSSYGAQAVGDYTLIAAASSAIVGSIGANQSRSGTLSSTDFDNPTRQGSYRDDYSLTGVTAGQQVRVNLSANFFDTYLQLINSSTGEVIDYNDDANGTTNSELIFTVQSGVNYIIRIASYFAQDTGNYTLTTTTSGNASIGSNQSVTGSLDTTDTLSNGYYSDFYQLTGVTTGQQIRINLNSSTFDTYLYLVNASNGSTILSNDDSGDSTNSELTFTVQSGINYRIQVSSYFTNETGSYTLTTTSSASPSPSPTQDWYSQNIVDAGLREIIRNRAGDGTLDRNDMLAIFRNAQDDSVIDANEVADLRRLVSNSTRFRMPDYVEFLSTRVSEGATVNMSASTFELNVLGRWFLGTIAPTARFTDQIAGRTYNLTYVQAQGNLFGSSGRAQIGDIDQGNWGDCAFLGALGATFAPQSNDSGNQRSSIIDSMIIDNGDNTYTIRFYSNSTPNWVTVDRRLATFNGELFGARANGSANPNNPANVLWSPLVERAYAQWREWREGAPGYDLIGNGDSVNRPLQFVTGRTATPYYVSSITFNQIVNALQSGQAIQLGSQSYYTSYTVPSHAYTLTNAYTTNTGQQRIVVRNPWGVDNQSGRLSSGSPNDGFIDLSFSEYRSSFYAIAFA